MLWCAKCGAYSQSRVGKLQQKCSGGATANGKQYLRMIKSGRLPGRARQRLHGPAMPVNVRSWTGPANRPVLEQRLLDHAPIAPMGGPPSWKTALDNAKLMVGLPVLVPDILDG